VPAGVAVPLANTSRFTVRKERCTAIDVHSDPVAMRAVSRVVPKKTSRIT
jgi:hypothetical protein